MNEILAKYLDDRESLTDEELEQLIAACERDPELAKELRSLMQLDDLIDRELAPDRQGFARSVLHRTDPELKRITVEDIEALARRDGRGRKRIRTVLAFAAAALIAVIISFAVLRESPYERGIAPKVALSDNSAIDVGDVIELGTDLRSTGVLRLEYLDGTTVQLDGNSRILVQETERRKRLTLTSGQCIIDASPQPADAPIVLSTPHMTVRVLGTRFVLNVNSSESVVQMNEGTVDVEPVKGEARQVRAGEFACATKDNLEAGDFYFEPGADFTVYRKYIEAEDGQGVDPNEIRTDNQASNNSFIVHRGRQNKAYYDNAPEEGVLKYHFSTPVEGEYSIYLRLKTPTIMADSFWVRVPEADPERSTGISRAAGWVKVNHVAFLTTNWAWHRVNDATSSPTKPIVVRFHLPKGRCTLELAYREVDTQLDRIFITNTDAVPSD